MFETLDAELGPVTALVNNAGILETRVPLDEMEPEFLARIFAVNTFSCFYCAGQAIKRMSTAHGGPGGAIVNISSKAAVLGGLPGWSHYAASNGAVDSFTISLAKEVGPQGIRVNAIRPGVIPTDIQKAATDVDFPSAARQTTSLGRMGTVEEVAEAALWLLSPQASYVHGIVLDVSGGR
jgi:NAD(P)-dependent dehydrogenase (short-subunit alcohol dehydrogenase family)